MHRPETKIEKEVEILCIKSMHRINWRIFHSILQQIFVAVIFEMKKKAEEQGFY
jgi:hypothetical protein